MCEAMDFITDKNYSAVGEMATIAGYVVSIYEPHSMHAREFDLLHRLCGDKYVGAVNSPVNLGLPVVTIVKHCSDSSMVILDMKVNQDYTVDVLTKDDCERIYEFKSSDMH